VKLVFIIGLLLFSVESKSDMYLNENVVMSKDNAKDVTCKVMTIGIFGGAEDELVNCVNSYLAEGYEINEKKTKSDLNKLKKLMDKKAKS
jgi:hypothetical protein|tara:strand:- start:29 stop:298 length:270 start_codon:yes stop_codon:yes gene_type:complete